MSIIAIILLGIIDYYGYNYYGFKFENMYCNKYRFIGDCKKFVKFRSYLIFQNQNLIEFQAFYQ